MNKQNTVIKVEKGSIAEEMGIEVGDILLEINGQQIKDVFDYRYLIHDEYLVVDIQKANGEQWSLEIEKEEWEDLGFVFGSGLMDRAMHCSNRCIFCFIDQLPKGMRKELYFKDDDSRLSFLHGNYVTLTNMSDEDIDRIVFYHLSPINISVHTTNMELREKMLKNKNVTNLMDYITRLSEGGIKMNFQIVLCRNINDGKELERTIKDLGRFIENTLSISIVPFGRTKFREGLYDIELFDKDSASKVIDEVEEMQKYYLKNHGTYFCHLSDEFYIMAERPMPEYDTYEGFPQLENGVGMITLQDRELHEAIENTPSDNIKRTLSVATGKSAFNFINKICKDITKKFPNTHILVYCIENEFFGKDITVSGLLTGSDIVSQLKDKKLGSALIISENAFSNDTDLMLDDMTRQDVEKHLNVRVIKGKCDGTQMLKQILDVEDK